MLNIFQIESNEVLRLKFLAQKLPAILLNETDSSLINISLRINPLHFVRCIIDDDFLDNQSNTNELDVQIQTNSINLYKFSI